MHYAAMLLLESSRIHEREHLVGAVDYAPSSCACVLLAVTSVRVPLALPETGQLTFDTWLPDEFGGG